ncbi:MAG TPA: hypothetical protein VK179_12340 [Bacteroidales bacterium]|nr:hypothetical protein [Bacteroidales bacterium]
MRIKIRIFILFFGPLSCFQPTFPQCNADSSVTADTSYLIRYKGYVGYIFPGGYHGDIVDYSIKTFRLTIDQVNRVEKILLQQYNEAFKNDSRVSRTYQPVDHLSAYLKEFDRQYLGFFNLQGERSALVLLSRRKEGKQYFNCFDRVMSVGEGDFYAKNQRFFIVNLDRKTLSLP